jgi:AcrR family transcriptional regulator
MDRKDAMIARTPLVNDDEQPVTEPHADSPVAKSRDADNTRNLLLTAARKHFARDGYAAATVRDIASEAGVNVALINRYFLSKEGLFEACLAHAAENLSDLERGPLTLPRIQQTMVNQIVGGATGDRQLQLMLLLRTSGDESADRIRRNTLELFAKGIATAAGWVEGEPDDHHLLIGAQIVLATVVGIVLMTSSTGLEPLTSSTEAELAQPIFAIFDALLGPATGPASKPTS